MFFGRLKRPGKEFDISKMMVVDLLHEFELGVWKSLLTHLIWVLNAASERPGELADILNMRYVQIFAETIFSHSQDGFRRVPAFGRFTVQRFHNNISEMKKLAACDFEDILQVNFIYFLNAHSPCRPNC